MRIEFSQPLGYDVEPKLVAGLRRVAMRAAQIAAVRKRDGDLPRRSRMQRRGNTDLVEKDVQTGGAVEYVEPRRATAQLPKVSPIALCRDFHRRSTSCRMFGFQDFRLRRFIVHTSNGDATTSMQLTLNRQTKADFVCRIFLHITHRLLVAYCLLDRCLDP